MVTQLNFYLKYKFHIIFLLNRVYFYEHFYISFVFFRIKMNFIYSCNVSAIYEI